VIETTSELQASEIQECLLRLPEDRTRWTRRIGELMEEGGQRAIDEAIGIFCKRLVTEESENVLLSLLLDRSFLLPLHQSVYETDRIRFREALSKAHADEPKLHTRIAKRLAELLAAGSLARINEILCLFDSVVQLSGMTNLAGALQLLRNAEDPRLRARTAPLPDWLSKSASRSRCAIVLMPPLPPSAVSTSEDSSNKRKTSRLVPAPVRGLSRPGV
jgi:hypothetical protein